MPSIEAMNPVYFARKQGEGEPDDDYNTAIAQNENLMNQNFKVLYDALIEMSSSIAALQTKG
jgi:hypothetical protein